MKYSLRLRRLTDSVLVLASSGLITTAFAQTSGAGGALDRFADNVRGLDTRFVQQLIDADGLAVEYETATGRFQMQRPDRFRWHQDPPFEVIAVSDGELVWIYDVDLEQVTCSAYSEFAASPAQILSGEGGLGDNFVVVDLPADDGRRRVRLTPLAGAVSDFVTATVTLEDDIPVALEILDGLEQTTRVEFSEITVDPDFAPETFAFLPPDGVDVVCDID